MFCTRNSCCSWYFQSIDSPTTLSCTTLLIRLIALATKTSTAEVFRQEWKKKGKKLDAHRACVELVIVDDKSAAGLGLGCCCCLMTDESIYVHPFVECSVSSAKRCNAMNRLLEHDLWSLLLFLCAGLEKTQTIGVFRGKDFVLKWTWLGTPLKGVI